MYIDGDIPYNKKTETSLMLLKRLSAHISIKNVIYI